MKDCTDKAPALHAALQRVEQIENTAEADRFEEERHMLALADEIKRLHSALSASALANHD